MACKCLTTIPVSVGCPHWLGKEIVLFTSFDKYDLINLFHSLVLSCKTAFGFLAVQIHFTECQHWVTSSCFGGNVQLYDSNVGRLLTTSLEIQLAQMYGAARKNNHLIIKQMRVQQQSNGRDCGLFAIAYAFHASLGDDLTKLNFNCNQMRQHLINCFDQGMLSPFPVSRVKTSRRCAARQYCISLFCSCFLPKSYSRSMVECYVCETLYHDTCVTTNSNQEPWICSECCMD